LTYEEIIKSIKSKQFKPIYALHGDEGFFIDGIVKQFEDNVLSEGEKAFNFTVVYGKDANAISLMDAAARYPMMSPYQLIILKEAQDMKTLKDLQPYMEKPVPTTIFVIAHKHKRIDMRSSFAKSLKKEAVIFESKKLYDNKIAGWITSYVKSKKLEITPNAAELIGEYLGTNLSKVANELDKIAINLPKGSSITDKVVQDKEMAKAMGLHAKNDYAAAFMVKKYKTTIRNFSMPQVKRIIGLLREYDLRAKGVNNTNTPPSALLQELVYKILS